MSEELSLGDAIAGAAIVDEPAAPEEAPETSDPNTVTDLGSGDTLEEPDAPEEPQETAAPKAATPKPSKHKLKRGGEEGEYTIEDLIRFSGDDYRHKVTIDGREEEMTIAQMLPYASQGQASHARMRQAAQMRKDNEARERSWLKDPSTYFAARNQDPFEYASQVLSEHVQMQELKAHDPDRYIHEMQNRSSEWQAQKQGFEDERAKVESDGRQRQEELATYHKSLPSAFQQAGLANTPTLVGVVNKVLQDAKQSGQQLDPASVAQFVSDHMRRDQAAQFEGMEGPAILTWLGEDVRKKIRQAEVTALKKPTKQGGKRKPTTPAASTPAAPTKGLTVAEIMRGEEFG